MKAEKGILYFTEDYVAGKLIDKGNVFTEHPLEGKVLSREKQTLLKSILVNHTTVNGHKCITVYRDAIIIGEDTYNICLSCGDYYKNEDHYYLSNEGVDQIKTLIK